MPRRHHGFTLIELLVVVAIIAILAAILFPVMAKARQKAHQTQFMSNLRQISMAMRMYAGDCDSMLPLVRSYSATPLYLGSWIHSLQPYATNDQLFICPAAAGTSTSWRNNNDLLKSYGYPPAAGSFVDGMPPIYSLVSFHGTARFDGLGGYGNGPMGMYRRPADSKRLTAIERAAETVLVSDHVMYDWGLGTGNVYYPAIRHMRSSSAGSFPRGQVDTCFVDGHVKALQHEAYWEVRDINSTVHGPVRVYWHHWPWD